MTVAERIYRPKGAAARLFDMRDPEILYESPAGAGKTRAIGEYCNALCEEYPGIRILFCRQTRASLSESVMPIFEQHVLWPGHPVLLQGGGASRSHYQYPNGSRIVLQGLEEPERTYSSQYDVVVVFECFEISLTAWQMLARACRNGVLPWQQMIAETNPAEETHWLNRRAEAGTMVRLKGKHSDNPSLKPEYLARLAGLTGYLRARLYLGEWVGVSGLIWETYDPAIHLLDEEQIPWDGMTWYFGAQDWGFTDPGCLQVYGVVPGATRDADRIYRVAEWYATGQSLDWWASQAVAADAEFGLTLIACDPSRPDCIQKFNDMIGAARGRPLARIAREANNQRRSARDMAGLDLVRWAFSAADEFGPRLFLRRNALQHGPDETLAEKGRPTCTEEEIGSYSYETDNNGDALEEARKGASDHGCDALRYAANFVWKRDMTPQQPPKVYAPDSYGAILGLGEEGDA